MLRYRLQIIAVFIILVIIFALGISRVKMEMNISLAQNPDAIAEIKELMSTNETLISSKFMRPMLTLKEVTCGALTETVWSPLEDPVSTSIVLLGA